MKELFGKQKVIKLLFSLIPNKLNKNRFYDTIFKRLPMEALHHNV